MGPSRRPRKLCRRLQTLLDVTEVEPLLERVWQGHQVLLLVLGLAQHITEAKSLLDTFSVDPRFILSLAPLDADVHGTRLEGHTAHGLEGHSDRLPCMVRVQHHGTCTQAV